MKPPNYWNQLTGGWAGRPGDKLVYPNRKTKTANERDGNSGRQHDREEQETVPLFAFFGTAFYFRQ